MKIAVRSDALDEPEQDRRAERVLEQARDADRDDEEEADRERERRGDGQAPGEAADLLALAVLVLLLLGVGGEGERAGADLQRLDERDDAADDRPAQRPVALRPRDERLGADLDLAVGLADRDRPGRDAAHHHALEHRLAADRRVPGADGQAVGHSHRVDRGPLRSVDAQGRVRVSDRRAPGGA